MSDLGNGSWPNSMKLGEDTDLVELLQKHNLFDFVSGCLQLSRESQLSGHIKITTESPRKSNGMVCFYQQPTFMSRDTMRY